MREPDLLGKCLCGNPCYGQSVCDDCDKEPIDKTYKCDNCGVDEVELEGQICSFCIEEAHEDRKCFDDCPLCSNERDKIEYGRDDDRY